MFLKFLQAVISWQNPNELFKAFGEAHFESFCKDGSCPEVVYNSSKKHFMHRIFLNFFNPQAILFTSSIQKK